MLSAIDIYLQMSMESAALPSFLDSCSTETWFRTVSMAWRMPAVDEKVLEKLSIILQKLSKMRYIDSSISVVIFRNFSPCLVGFTQTLPSTVQCISKGFCLQSCEGENTVSQKKKIRSACCSASVLARTNQELSFLLSLPGPTGNTLKYLASHHQPRNICE